MTEEIVRDSATSDSTNIRFSVPTDGVRDSIATSGIRDSYLSYSTGVPESVLSEDDHTKPLEPNEKHAKQKNAKWYKRKTFWTFCGVSTIILTIILVPVIIFGIFPKIAQSSINKSQITYDQIIIGDPITDTDFKISISGSLSGGGNFDADASFPDPIQVYWEGALLGEVPMSSVKLRGGQADFTIDDTFTIKDAAKFSEFTIYTLTAETFTWNVQGKVKIKALGITKSGLTLNKDIVLPGGDGFSHTKITNITLPDHFDPSNFSLTYYGYLYNPSPIGIHIGHTVFNVFFGDSFIGPGEIDDLVLVPGNNTLVMTGYISPSGSPTSIAGLLLFVAKVAQGQRLTVLAQGVSAETAGKNITWIDTAVRSMSLTPIVSTAPFTLPPYFPSNMNPLLSESTAPLRTDDSVSDYQLPFTAKKRSLAQRDLSYTDVLSLIEKNLPAINATVADVVDALQKADIFKSGGSFLDILLALVKPFVQDIIDGSTIDVKSSSISDIKADSFTAHLVGSLSNTGPLPATISFPSGVTVKFQNTTLGKLLLPPIDVQPGAGATIEQDAKFTITDVDAFTQFAGFMLKSKEFTWDLSADDLNVQSFIFSFPGLQINKSITLKGFDGLKNVKIKKFSVLGPAKSGKPGVEVGLVNTIPNVADIGIDMGAATFVILSSKIPIGTASAAHLSLTPQKVATVPMSGELVGTDQDKALIGPMFSLFLAGKPIPMVVKGDTVRPSGVDGPVPWLENPFKQLALDLTLQVPPSKLIDQMEVVFSPSTVISGKAVAKITMTNPVGADFTIQAIDSEAFFLGEKIGEVHKDFGKNPIVVPGGATATTPDIEITIVIPSDIKVLIGLAQSGGNIETDVKLQTNALVATLPATITYQQEKVPTKMSFDLSFLNFIKLKAITPEDINTIDKIISEFVPKKRDLVKRDLTLEDIVSQLQKLDIVKDPAAIINNVTSSLQGLNLPKSQLDTFAVGDVLKPIIQPIIDGSKLSVSSSQISHIKTKSFVTHLVGEISNAGSVPATISFPTGVTVSFEKKKLGKLLLPAVNVSDGVAKFDNDVDFKIADVEEFTKFSGAMLANKDFTWKLFAKDVVVNIPLIEIKGLTLDKEITVKGFDGLKDSKVKDLKVTGPSKQGAGVALTIVDTFKNHAEVGIELGDVTFDLVSNKLVFGDASASDVKFKPKKPSDISVAAEILQTAENEKFIGPLISAFLAGQPIAMTAKGKSASPPGTDQPVPWLEEPFKNLALDVKLNAPPAKLVQHVDITLTSQTTADVTFTVFNNVDTDVAIAAINSTSSFQGKPLTTLIHEFDPPVVLAAQKNTTFPPVSFTLPTEGPKLPIGQEFLTDVQSLNQIVIVIAGNNHNATEFRAHSCILWARSEYFRKQLTEMRRTFQIESVKIRVESIESQVFAIILR
ncbi:9702_t:CDS:2 [Paraglomus occultum]|uniref:9702_t:CDS:1 n=1 Tax=Paraglomus occultum TaxID=144539 RepID=A0A9N8W7K2_9GLOM|nr:9702_t:CDS:2 [Paraglomus occultum]